MYSIWVCTDAPAGRRGTIVEYAMKKHEILGDISEPEQNYDLMRLLIVCHGDEKENSADGGKILRLLAALFRKDVAPEKRRQVMSGEFGIDFRNDDFSGEVNEMCNLSMGVLVDGYKKGRTTTSCESIQSLMRTMNIPFDKAVDHLGYDDKMRETCHRRLEEGNASDRK